MKKPFVHPILFAIFPILFLLSHNVERVSFCDVLLPFVVVLGLAALLLLLAKLVLKNGGKAGIVVSLFLILFFSYGHIFDMARNWHVGSFVVGQHIYLMLVWCELLVCGVYFFVRTRKDLGNLTNILNIVAVSLVVMSLVNIGVYKLRIGDTWQNDRFTEEPESGVTDLDASIPRDIYYIILDGYASSSTLEEIYGYDNHEFIDHLTAKGFYVASKSLSNYPSTYYSLASSLNMKYINYLTEIVGAESKDMTLLSQMIEDNKVMNLVKSEGYTFIYFSSGWGPTEGNRYADLDDADLDVQCGAWGGVWDEFTTVLIQTTMLRPFEGYILGGDARAGVLCAFVKLAEAHKIEGPKFVFAHIISPHPPFLFGANGEPVPEAILNLDGYVWEQKEDYINQLIFVNKKVKTLVDAILSGSDVPPIIILQADHGPASTFGSITSPAWSNPTEDMLRERLRIFNAYYLPAGGESVLYDSVSPVNTFRLVFNFYFGADYELLDDQSYHVTQDHPYVFVNVTGKIEHD